MQFPHENHHQSTAASNTRAKTPRAGPASATTINSTKASDRTADRRTNRETYSLQKQYYFSSGSDIQAATEESSKAKDSHIEKAPRSDAKSRGGSRIPAGFTLSGLFKEALKSSRSVADPAPLILPGRTKKWPSSLFSEAND